MSRQVEHQGYNLVVRTRHYLSIPVSPNQGWTLTHTHTHVTKYKRENIQLKATEEESLPKDETNRNLLWHKLFYTCLSHSVVFNCIKLLPLAHKHTCMNTHTYTIHYSQLRAVGLIGQRDVTASAGKPHRHHKGSLYSDQPALSLPVHSADLKGLRTRQPADTEYFPNFKEIQRLWFFTE